MGVSIYVNVHVPSFLLIKTVLFFNFIFIPSVHFDQSKAYMYTSLKTFQYFHVAHLIKSNKGKHEEKDKDKA